jgi:hypothetical protein
MNHGRSNSVQVHVSKPIGIVCLRNKSHFSLSIWICVPVETSNHFSTGTEFYVWEIQKCVISAKSLVSWNNATWFCFFPSLSRLRYLFAFCLLFKMKFYEPHQEVHDTDQYNILWTNKNITVPLVSCTYHWRINIFAENFYSSRIWLWRFSQPWIFSHSVSQSVLEC